MASWPALYLYPLNHDSFVKHISLAQNQRVKIGRQTNARTVPAENNGYFDSKVLSRQHAEVWEEGGKIFIKDVKSSNGTFINGDRLSPEGLESEPYELKSDDIVEFGIDIVGEDNKTIIHHKVAARVVCVFSEQDAIVAARAEQHQAQHALSHHHHQPPSHPTGAPQGAGPGLLRPNGVGAGGPGSAGNFSFAPSPTSRRPGAPPALATGPTAGPPQAAGLGGMGGPTSLRPAGQKSGLTFDHILSRLQGELQKSRETGAELSGLGTVLGEVEGVLGGGGSALPPNAPHYPSTLPPVRPPPQEHQVLPPPPSTSAPAAPASVPSETLTELQTQLRDTQSSLANHVDKVRAFEGVFAEQESIKRELALLREMVEREKRSKSPHHLEQSGGEQEDEVDDDDDARSVATVTPHELERVDEEDEEAVMREQEHENEEPESEEERRRRRAELGRPRTPEPSSLGMLRHGHEHEEDEPHPQVKKIEELTARLEKALELTSSLQAQHIEAQGVIKGLEEKVGALEGLVKASQQVAAQAAAAVASPPPEEREREKEREKESLTAFINEWKKSVEGQWSSVREEWVQERERLASAREEWEARAKSVESNIANATNKVDAGLASLALLQTQHQQQQQRQLGNGNVLKGFGGNRQSGLVTPPSPRSLSADSNRPRRKRGSRGRGRSGSRSCSPAPSLEPLSLKDHGDPISELDDHDEAIESDTNASIRRPFSPGDGELRVRTRKDSSEGSVSSQEVKQLETPESSVHQVPVGGVGAWSSALASASASSQNHRADGDSTVVSDSISNTIGTGKAPGDTRLVNQATVSTAVGVLVLSVAAAAVIWKVQPLER